MGGAVGVPGCTDCADAVGLIANATTAQKTASFAFIYVSPSLVTSVVF